MLYLITCDDNEEFRIASSGFLPEDGHIKKLEAEDIAILEGMKSKHLALVCSRADKLALDFIMGF